MGDHTIGYKEHPHYVGGFDARLIGFLIAMHALALAGLFFPSWEGLLAFVVLYIATGMGVTVGYHRLLTHASYSVPKSVRRTIAIVAALSGEGPALFWVAWHRLHHKYSDKPGDPHSPHHGGFWHAHTLWTMAFIDSSRYADIYLKNTKDLLKQDKAFYLAMNTYYSLMHVALFVALFAFGFAWGWLVHDNAWYYAASVAGYGFFFRMIVVLHSTWLVNSAAHLWGDRPYPDKDQSRNNWFVAMLTFGEGWHNNHHACQKSYRHGVEWWQPDLSACAIEAMEKVGLATIEHRWIPPREDEEWEEEVHISA